MRTNSNLPVGIQAPLHQAARQRLLQSAASNPNLDNVHVNGEQQVSPSVFVLVSKSQTPQGSFEVKVVDYNRMTAEDKNGAKAFSSKIKNEVIEEYCRQANQKNQGVKEHIPFYNIPGEKAEQHAQNLGLEVIKPLLEHEIISQDQFKLILEKEDRAAKEAVENTLCNVVGSTAITIVAGAAVGGAFCTIQ